MHAPTIRSLIPTTLGLTLLVSTSALSFGAGCGAKDDDDELASASVTSALQASQHGGLTQDLVEVEGEAAIAPAKAADFVVSRRPLGVQPEGCMTRTRNGDTVHIVFAGCTGPFGKMRLDGSADVHFSLDDQKRLVANIVGGPDLRANDRALDYKARGVLEINGDVRNVTWHAEAAGETKRGRKYSRQTDVNVSVDLAKRCLEANGVAKGSIAGFDLELTIEDLAVCEGACPTSGKATASLTGPGGRERSMSLTFDGSDRAHVVTPKGRKLDIEMSCADGEASE